jgi:hypothetical protein
MSAALVRLSGWLSSHCHGSGTLALGTHQPVDPPPVAPDDPELPVDPVGPDEPVGPEEPVLPVEPVEPVVPVEPVLPVAPVQPLAPGCFLQYVADRVVGFAVLAFLAVLAIAAPVKPVAATIPTAATRPATRCRRLSLELRLRGDMEMLLVVLGDWSFHLPHRQRVRKLDGGARGVQHSSQFTYIWLIGCNPGNVNRRPSGDRA